MFPYISVAIVLIIYFELLGKAFLSKIKKNDYLFGFEWGLILYTALTIITTGFLGLYGGKTLIAFGIYAFLFFAGFILIIKERKNIEVNKNILYWILLIVFNIVLCYFSYKTTFGNMYGFDTETYGGLVSTIGISDKLNSICVSSGVRLQSTTIQYNMQTYYYLASFIQIISLKFFNLLNIEVSRLSLFTWVFQILFNHLFLALILETFNRHTRNKHIFNCIALLFMVFFYGKLYFNNVFGFYGNSFRTIIFSYISLVTFDYFLSHSRIDKFLIGLSILSACSFSSTSFFISIFFIYGLFFATIDFDDNFFRFVAIGMFIPIFAIICTLLSNRVNISLCISIIISLLLFIFNDKLVLIFRKKEIRICLLTAITIIMLVMSFNITRNLLDFSAFFNNLSINGDMVLTYTKPNVSSIEGIYVLIAEIALITYMIKNRNNKFVLLVGVLIISFFNPFCCAILNKMNIVYYRSYEIFLNPCTWIITLAGSLELLNNKYINGVICAALAAIFISKTNIATPIYYHYSFIPNDDYNGTLRMTNDEYDAIKYIEKDFKYRGIEIPFIANSNLLTQSIIPEGRFVFTREADNQWFNDENAKMIYKIFYPVEYYRDYADDGIDISEMNTYIENSGLDYLVIDKNLSYFNAENNDYEYLYMKVLELSYDNVYENDHYIVFYYNRGEN